MAAAFRERICRRQVAVDSREAYSKGYTQASGIVIDWGK